MQVLDDGYKRKVMLDILKEWTLSVELEKTVVMGWKRTDLGVQWG